MAARLISSVRPLSEQVEGNGVKGEGWRFRVEDRRLPVGILVLVLFRAAGPGPGAFVSGEGGWNLPGALFPAEAEELADRGGRGYPRRYSRLRPSRRLACGLRDHRQGLGRRHRRWDREAESFHDCSTGEFNGASGRGSGRLGIEVGIC